MGFKVLEDSSLALLLQAEAATPLKLRFSCSAVTALRLLEGLQPISLPGLFEGDILPTSIGLAPSFVPANNTLKTTDCDINFGGARAGTIV